MKHLDIQNKTNKTLVHFSINEAEFSTNLVQVGGTLGAIKGALDQPAEQVLDQETGTISDRKYNPLERATTVGVNAAVGAGLGYGAQKTGLLDPRKAGRKFQEVKDAISQKIELPVMSKYIPDVEVTYEGKRVIPKNLKRRIKRSWGIDY